MGNKFIIIFMENCTCLSMVRPEDLACCHVVSLVKEDVVFGITH